MKIRQMDGKVVRQWWVICKPEPYEALVGEAGTDADFGGRSDEVCMDNFKNEGRYGNVGVERLRCGGMSNSNDISRLCTLLEDTVKAVDKFARLMFVTAEMSPVQCFAVVEQKVRFFCFTHNYSHQGNVTWMIHENHSNARFSIIYL